MHWLRIQILLIVLIPVGSSLVQAQNSHYERWEGEWGEYQYTPPIGKALGYYTGFALSIQNCSTDHCQLHFVISSRGGHADAMGSLIPDGASAATATARLGYGENPQCTLNAALKEGIAPAISVQKGNGDCSNFVTPGVSFEHDYPLHARAWYVAWNLPECYASSEPSVAALCTAPHLSDLEQSWTLLVWQVSDLGPKIDKDAERAHIFTVCDKAANAVACLAKSFADDSDRLIRAKNEWVAQVTATGDIEAARKATDSIAGTYQHSFSNGDVQGNHFRSIDTLSIRTNLDGSIHFSVDLEFFNGHQCNREGDASYRQAGFFAQIEPSDQSLPCVFEIIPTIDSVELRDPTGSCRQSDCGLRGGYNGAKFLLSERHPPTVEGRSNVQKK